MEPLKKANNFKGPQGPVVLAILDGVGYGTCEEGDLVNRSNTPTLYWLAQNAMATKLKAHGTAVGMPSDADMGNSEIGHNAVHAGMADRTNMVVGYWKNQFTQVPIPLAVSERKKIDPEAWLWGNVVSCTGQLREMV